MVWNLFVGNYTSAVRIQGCPDEIQRLHRGKNRLFDIHADPQWEKETEHHRDWHKGFMAGFDSEASVTDVREDEEAMTSDVSYYHRQNLGKDSGGCGYSEG